MSKSIGDGISDVVGALAIIGMCLTLALCTLRPNSQLGPTQECTNEGNNP